MNDIAIGLKKEFLFLLTDKLVCNNGLSKDEAKEEAEILMSNRWNDKFEYISGRKFFQQLSYWTQDEFSINISAYQVASYFHTYEIPLEVKNVLSKIIRGEFLD